MANEEVNEDMINTAVAKYAGDDSAYADKLKKHVTNYVGYSNQVAKMPQVDAPEAVTKMGGGVAQSFLRGNITPSGVNSLSGAGIGLINQETSALKSLARGSKSKASSAEAQGDAYGQLSGFKAEDGLDNAIQRWMNNPRNEEGHYKSLEELQQELEGAVTGGDAQWGEADVAARLAQRVPEEYREDLQETYYKSLGYSNTETDNLVKFDRYSRGEMSEAESELYKVTDPSFAAKAEIMKGNPGLQSDLDKLQMDSPEALPYKELEQKYPNITPEVVKPYYEKAAMSDVRGMAEEMGLTAILPDKETGEITKKSLESFLESKSAGEVKKTLSLVYQGILTPAEIEYQLYQFYLDDTAGFQQ